VFTHLNSCNIVETKDGSIDPRARLKNQVLLRAGIIFTAIPITSCPSIVADEQLVADRFRANARVLVKWAK